MNAIIEKKDLPLFMKVIEQEVKSLPQIECPVRHYFSDGLYCREMFIPKGSMIVGKIHKKACMNFLMQGDISILTKLGMRRVKAPFIVESGAGMQKIGYAHEDTVWVTAHATLLKDPEEFEEFYTLKDMPCLLD